ncbi:unnamed protein product [Lota lota]
MWVTSRSKSNVQGGTEVNIMVSWTTFNATLLKARRVECSVETDEVWKPLLPTRVSGPCPVCFQGTADYRGAEPVSSCSTSAVGTE